MPYCRSCAVLHTLVVQQLIRSFLDDSNGPQNQERTNLPQIDTDEISDYADLNQAGRMDASPNDLSQESFSDGNESENSETWLKETVESAPYISKKAVTYSEQKPQNFDTTAQQVDLGEPAFIHEEPTFDRNILLNMRKQAKSRKSTD